MFIVCAECCIHGATFAAEHVRGWRRGNKTVNFQSCNYYLRFPFISIYLFTMKHLLVGCMLVVKRKVTQAQKLILEKNLSSRSKFPAILNLFRIKVSSSSFYACEIFVKEIIFLALTESR